MSYAFYSFQKGLYLSLLWCLFPGIVFAEHRSNYAVILSSSRYWFNYRHTANALSVYQLLKRNGFHDDEISLMIADEWAVNPRNPAKNHIYNTAMDGLDGTSRGGVRPSLQTEDTIVDYMSEDVTVEQFLSVLLNAPTDESTNILIYLTGHGGDQFFKFQDVEEIMSAQLGDAIQQLHVARKFHQILLVADTCQAYTLATGIQSRQIPNVAVLGSSLKGQSSYAHMSNPILGLSVIEKYTHFFADRCERQPGFLDQSVRSIMIEGYSKQRLGRSELGLWDALCDPTMDQVPMKYFWKQKRQHHDISSIQPLPPLPRGLEALMSIHPEPQNKAETRFETCNASSNQCEAITGILPDNKGDNLVEPTNIVFVVLVFSLLVLVLVGSSFT